MQTSNKYWRTAIVYQIYPASFQDTTGSGVGDLRGIIKRLDVLKALGVDVVWLCPVYQSPQKDRGYDISDYEAIDPLYGSMADWEALLLAVHQRGMRLLMDLIVNHTSTQHSWFLKSRSSRRSNKRDWYIWRPPRRCDKTGERLPPNNWGEEFRGGSAWEWDELSGEYYLHLFSAAQPDLNWDNPDVRKAVWDVMRFWLDKGIGGFRMDVINCISKPSGLPNGVVNPGDQFAPGTDMCANGPRVHEYLQEMHDKVLSHYPNVMTVGEAPFKKSTQRLLPFILPARAELQMVFEFSLMELDQGNTGPMSVRTWTLPELKRVVERMQHGLHERGGWNALYLENHDQPRAVSRFGNDSPRFRAQSAKLLAMLQIAQSGTVYIFQGQEIGMKNVPEDFRVEDFVDLRTQTFFKGWLAGQRALTGQSPPSLAPAIDVARKKARDNGRTPMQWDLSPNAGFTSASAKSWMKVHDDYRDGWNVTSQMKDPSSVWNFWRQVLKVRKEWAEALIYGTYNLLPSHDQDDDESIMAFVKRSATKNVLVVLNFYEESQLARIDLQSLGNNLEVGFFLLSNYTDSIPAFLGPKEPGRVTMKLKAWEGVMFELKEQGAQVEDSQDGLFIPRTR